MNVSQVSSSRAFALEAYNQNSASGNKGYSATKANRNVDTVSFSGEALQLAALGNAGNEAEEAVARPNFQMTMKDDRKIDIASLFNELAEAKPEKFKDMLATLASGDPEEFIQALAYVTGESADDIRDALTNMTAEDAALLARQLNDLGVPANSAFFHGVSLATNLDIDKFMEWYKRC